MYYKKVNKRRTIDKTRGTSINILDKKNSAKNPIKTSFTICLLLCSCISSKVKVEEQATSKIDIKKEIPKLNLEKIEARQEGDDYIIDSNNFLKLYNNVKEMKTKYIWLRETYENDIDTLLIIVNKTKE